MLILRKHKHATFELKRFLKWQRDHQNGLGLHRKGDRKKVGAHE